MLGNKTRKNIARPEGNLTGSGSSRRCGTSLFGLHCREGLQPVKSQISGRLSSADKTGALGAMTR